MRPLTTLSVTIALVACTSDAPKKDDTDDTDKPGPTEAFAPNYTFVDSVRVDYGGIWSVVVWDGAQLIVSTENNGSIILATWDTGLNQTGDPITVAGPSDTSTGGGIADHKHLFQNNHHYITFSTAGEGMGGELLLLKLDADFNRVGFTTVVQDAPPTNDMFMVGDGSGVHVGKFLPGRGHEVYSFDADLNPTGNTPIGDGPDWRHANGASAAYHDGGFVVVAPQTLAPGDGDAFYRLVYDDQWRGLEFRKTILEEPSMLGIVSALSLDPNSGAWLIHYAYSKEDYGGDLRLSAFDENWDELHTEVAVSGTYQRPHSVVVGDTLFLGYDGGGAYLARFRYDGPAESD